MKSTNNPIFEKIFQLNPLIRFVGIYNNNELMYTYRKGITPYIHEENTKKSLDLAIKRWEERKELLSSEIGNQIYSVTMYETVKRIIMELKDGTLILITAELDIDHEKMILELPNMKLQ